MKRFDAADAGIDFTTPSPARIYHIALGGKDNWEADRKAFEDLLTISPDYVKHCEQSRAFLGRVVRAAAANGIRQFLDLGSGLPTQQNVHEIAHLAAPGSPVIYVDYDPVAVTMARARLGGGVNAWVIQKDVRQPREILGDELVRAVLNWDEPVLILLVSILHFVTDEERPAEIVRQLAEAAAPGSWLAIAHGTGDGIDPQRIADARDLYDSTSAPWVERKPQEVVRWLDGMRILPPGATRVGAWPGATRVGAWRPDAEDAAAANEAIDGMFGVVAEVMPRTRDADGG